MAVEIDIDVEVLKSEIKKTYASVSEQPEQDFIFPTGRAWAEDLGYPDELANVPEAAVESFAGVANPWTMGRLTSFAAARAASTYAFDPDAERVAAARAALTSEQRRRVRFAVHDAQARDLPRERFDVALCGWSL